MKSKLVKTILLCIVSIFCFTGCIRSEAIVEYKINGKADITMVYATSVGDKEAAAAADEETNKQLEEIPINRMVLRDLNARREMLISKIWSMYLMAQKNLHK